MKEFIHNLYIYIYLMLQASQAVFVQTFRGEVKFSTEFILQHLIWKF